LRRRDGKAGGAPQIEGGAEMDPGKSRLFRGTMLAWKMDLRMGRELGEINDMLKGPNPGNLCWEWRSWRDVFTSIFPSLRGGRRSPLQRHPLPARKEAPQKTWGLHAYILDRLPHPAPQVAADESQHGIWSKGFIKNSGAVCHGLPDEAQGPRIQAGNVSGATATLFMA